MLPWVIQIFLLALPCLFSAGSWVNYRLLIGNPWLIKGLWCFQEKIVIWMMLFLSKKPLKWHPYVIEPCLNQVCKIIFPKYFPWNWFTFYFTNFLNFAYTGGSLLMCGRSGVGRRNAVSIVSALHHAKLITLKMGKNYGLKQFKQEVGVFVKLFSVFAEFVYFYILSIINWLFTCQSNQLFLLSV